MSTNGSITARLKNKTGQAGGAVTTSVTKIDNTPPTITQPLYNDRNYDADSDLHSYVLSFGCLDSGSGLESVELHWVSYSFGPDGRSEYDGGEYLNVPLVPTDTNNLIRTDNEDGGFLWSWTYESGSGVPGAPGRNGYAIFKDALGNTSRSPAEGYIDVSEAIVVYGN